VLVRRVRTGAGVAHAEVTFASDRRWQTAHIGEVPPLVGTSIAGFPNASSRRPSPRARAGRPSGIFAFDVKRFSTSATRFTFGG